MNDDPHDPMTDAYNGGRKRPPNREAEGITVVGFVVLVATAAVVLFLSIAAVLAAFLNFLH